MAGVSLDVVVVNKFPGPAKANWVSEALKQIEKGKLSKDPFMQIVSGRPFVQNMDKVVAVMIIKEVMRAIDEFHPYHLMQLRDAKLWEHADSAAVRAISLKLSSHKSNNVGDRARSRSQPQRHRKDDNLDRAEAALAPSEKKSLVVHGGIDKQLAAIVEGLYRPFSQNHGKTVYKRESSNDTILLYYWDDRDGDEHRGWWFGPEVGGDEVWTSNAGSPSRVLPPLREWKVSHSGEIDPELRVGMAPADDYGISSGGEQPPLRSDNRASQRGVLSDAVVVQETPPAIGGFTAVQSNAGSTGTPASDARLPLGATEGPEAIRKWLLDLDEGQGGLLQYYDGIIREFHGDLDIIAATKVDGVTSGTLASVDPCLWSSLGVTKAGHKLLFARAIAQLR